MKEGRRQRYFEWLGILCIQWALSIGELYVLFHYTHAPLEWFCSPHAVHVCIVLHFFTIVFFYKVHFYLIERIFSHRYDTVSCMLYEDFSPLK